MEINKTYVSLFIIAIMLSSTLAYAILQSFTPTPSKPILPKENIIDYKLSLEQERILLDEGKTLLEFSYSLVCENCLEQKSYLESIANQLSDQIFLQEIKTETTIPKLKMKSSLGEKRLNNATSEEILDSLCELMVKPPIICALR